MYITLLKSGRKVVLLLLSATIPSRKQLPNILLDRWKPLPPTPSLPQASLGITNEYGWPLVGTRGTIGALQNGTLTIKESGF